MKLHQAFDLQRGEVLAFVGAGGKTSALVTLGKELVDAGWRVLATTTTRIGRDQLDLMPAFSPVDADGQAVSSLLETNRFVFLHNEIGNQKVRGATLEQIPMLINSINFDILLIEADGARGLPMKAPRPHEPVIPPQTSLVVPVVSLSVLGQPLDNDHVYNASLISEQYDYASGSAVKAAYIIQILQDEAIMLKGIPAKARVAALLNQVPVSGDLYDEATMIARNVMEMQAAKAGQRLDSIAIGSVLEPDPVHALFCSSD